MADRSDAAEPTVGSVSYVAPEGLHKNPASTNVVASRDPSGRCTWAGRTPSTPPAT